MIFAAPDADTHPTREISRLTATNGEINKKRDGSRGWVNLATHEAVHPFGGKDV